MSTPEPRTDKDALELFERALELEPGQRNRFVEEATASAELRAEVRALLDLEESGAEMPKVAPTPTLAAAIGAADRGLAPGTVVGAYRIECELGRGGMGRVYAAVQETPRRRVALKTLRRGLDNEPAVRRFLVEGELLGQLDHPGIARVYEAGVEPVEGVALPYIAMELLEDARPIDEYAEAERLGLKDRARLLAEVARALQHAHQRGVIHRDLKPANLLVDAAGRPHVIDFGIARASGLDLAVASVHTLAGQMLGTPAFMSPEQLDLAGGELDTRSDVYALGAVAYGLFCGAPPFDTESLSLAGLAREIAERGPRRPTAVAPDLPRDLEAIVLKAMARARDERYASAAAVADDLERFLRHEAIEARRPGPLHQLRLFARRNRLFAASVALAATSLLVGAAFSVWFGLGARASADLEREARERADDLLADLFDTNLAVVFDYADEASRLEGGTALRGRMLGDAAARLEEIEDAAQRDPELLAAVARAYVRLGDARGAFDQANAGDLEGAAEAYARAAVLMESLGAVDPQLAESSVDVARARMDLEAALGDQARSRTDFDAALPHYERAIAVGTAALDDHPDHLGLRADLLRRQRDLGLTLGSMKDWSSSLAAFEAVAGGWRELLARAPGDLTARYGLATALSSVASSTLYATGPEASFEVFRDTLAQFEAIARDHPDYRPARTALVGLRHAYTEALIAAQRFEQAYAQARTGRGLADELLVNDPNDVQVRRWRGLLFHNAGWALQSRAEAGLEDGAEADEVLADLALARDELRGSLAVFEGLRAEGKLLPFEQGHIPAILERIEAIDSLLKAQ